MLERLTPSELQARLGFSGEEGRPHVSAIARAARACVNAWRAPPRQRVTVYLTRQLIAAGFDEDASREEVRNTLDGLLDISDLASVRLDGKTSLVMAMATMVGIGANHYALLGAQARDVDETASSGLARLIPSAGTDVGGQVQDFARWLGPLGYQFHLERRAKSRAQGTLREFWSMLCAALRHEGLPSILRRSARVVAPPGTANVFFGRHGEPTVSGRWAQRTRRPMCAVRPGRNANEGIRSWSRGRT